MADQSPSLMNSTEVKQCPTELTFLQREQDRGEKKRTKIPQNTNHLFAKDDLQNNLKNSDCLKGEKYSI